MQKVQSSLKSDHTFCLAESSQGISLIEMWLKTRGKKGNQGLGAILAWELQPESGAASQAYEKWGSSFQSRAQQLSQHIGENLPDRKDP